MEELFEQGRKEGKMSGGKQRNLFSKGEGRSYIDLLACENQSRRIPFCLYTAMQSKFCPSCEVAFSTPCLQFLYAYLLIVPMTYNFLSYSHKAGFKTMWLPWMLDNFRSTLLTSFLFLRLYTIILIICY